MFLSRSDSSKRLAGACLIAGSFVLVAFAGAEESGQELRGAVIRVDDRTVVLEIESDMWPRVGDPVRLGQTMEGIEGLIFMRGEWTITQVLPENIHAEPGPGATGTPGVGYQAVIRSVSPQPALGQPGSAFGTSAEVFGDAPLDLDEITRMFDALVGTANGSAASYYEEGLRIQPKDATRAAALFVRAAEMGHAGAAEQAGIAYMAGKGVTPDDARAAPYFRQAAEAGLQLSQNNYAAFLATGRGGLTVDEQQASDWYHKAAAQGYAFAQTNLCIAYEKGDVVQQDLAEAVRYCRLAAEQNDPRGLDHLGWLYQRGVGVEKDLTKAFSLYEQAAKLGSANGQNNLAYMYEKGWGVKKDLDQALQWYLKSASQNWSNANWNLGRLYEEGLGVTPHPDKSRNYYREAARGGHQAAQQKLTARGESW